ncbi:MAG TPA: hypothetical protein VJ654_14670 [Noviherbaspirillum sp.]|nr:hypothetical protein [Noviherbaspirillum sp.]
MTTIVCNRSGMAADRRISDMPMFQAKKLFRVGGSLIGVAGSMDQCLRFVEWRRNPEVRPTFADSPSFSALELTSGGKILWWGSEMMPVEISEEFYAIGSGAPYALGALSAGKSLKEAVKIAARWNEATGPEVQTMNLRRK